MTDSLSSTDDVVRFFRIYIFARCLYLIVFCIGIIGNIFNLAVFFRKRFYINSCSIYFIAYSINNFMNLTVGLLLWSLTLGFGMNYENKNIYYCKIRRYFTHVNFLLSSCLITMASINRYARVRQAQLTTNRHRYVTLCERRTSYVITTVMILFSIIVNLHIPFIFQIEDGECYARSGPSRIFFDVFFLIFYALFPPIIMIAVNIATVRQIRCIRRLVHPTISRREYNFIILVVTHSCSNAVLTLPFTIHKFIYYTVNSVHQSETNQLIGCIALLIAFMNPGLSFFLYTLTTKSFRHEFQRFCKTCLSKLQCCCQIQIIDDDENVIRRRRATTASVLSLPMTVFRKLTE